MEFQLQFRELLVTLIQHSRSGYSQVQHTIHRHLMERQTAIQEVHAAEGAGLHKELARLREATGTSSGTWKIGRWKKGSLGSRARAVIGTDKLARTHERVINYLTSSVRLDL